VFFSLVNLSGAVSAISLWLAITVSLGLFDNDARAKHTLGRTLPVQLLLMAVLLISCAISFMWVDSEITKGSRRYQLTDAAGVALGPCDATCDLSPPLSVVLCSVSLGLQYAAQGECSVDVQVNITLMICGAAVFLLLGYDIHCQDSFNQKLKLPPGKKYLLPSITLFFLRLSLQSSDKETHPPAAQVPFLPLPPPRVGRCAVRTAVPPAHQPRVQSLV
jgi:hypothetical protein